MAKVEFYIGRADKHIAVVDADVVPRAGEFVNIRKRTYRVLRVTWAVDDADAPAFSGTLRANVELERADHGAQPIDEVLRKLRLWLSEFPTDQRHTLTRSQVEALCGAERLAAALDVLALETPDDDAAKGGA